MELGFLTITALYIIELCKLVRRYPNKFPLCTLKSIRLQGKFRGQLQLPLCRTATYKRTVKFRAAQVYNALSLEMKSLDDSKFFKALRAMLIRLCPYDISEFYDNLNCID